MESKNIRKVAILFALILGFVFNVNYVNAEEISIYDDIVIDTDYQEVKGNEIVAKAEENQVRKEAEEAKVTEAKSESVTKAQDNVSSSKTEEVVQSEAPRAPSENTKVETKAETKSEETKSEEPTRDGNTREATVATAPATISEEQFTATVSPSYLYTHGDQLTIKIQYSFRVKNYNGELKLKIAERLPYNSSTSYPKYKASVPEDLLTSLNGQIVSSTNYNTLEWYVDLENVNTYDDEGVVVSGEKTFTISLSDIPYTIHKFQLMSSIYAVSTYNDGTTENNKTAAEQIGNGKNSSAIYFVPALNDTKSLTITADKSEITDLEESITYTINYNYDVTNANDALNLRITDTLPYIIDEENELTSLAGGTYSATNKNIIWNIPIEEKERCVDNVCTPENVNGTIVFTVVYDKTSLQNNIKKPIENKAKASLTAGAVTSNQASSTISDQKVSTTIDVAATIRIKYKDYNGNPIPDVEDTIIETTQGTSFTSNALDNYLQDLSEQNYVFSYFEGLDSDGKLLVNEPEEELYAVYDIQLGKTFDFYVYFVGETEPYTSYEGYEYSTIERIDRASGLIDKEGIAKLDHATITLDGVEYPVTEYTGEGSIYDDTTLDFGTYGAPKFYYTDGYLSLVYFNTHYVNGYTEKKANFYYEYTDQDVDYNFDIYYYFIDEYSTLEDALSDVDYMDNLGTMLDASGQTTYAPEKIIYFASEHTTYKAGVQLDKEYLYGSTNNVMAELDNSYWRQSGSIGYDKSSTYSIKGQIGDEFSVAETMYDEQGNPIGIKIYGEMIHSDVSLHVILLRQPSITVRHILYDGDNETVLQEEPKTYGLSGDKRHVAMLENLPENIECKGFTLALGDYETALYPYGGYNAPYQGDYKDLIVTFKYFNKGLIKVHHVDKEGHYIETDKEGNEVVFTTDIYGSIGSSYANLESIAPIEITGYVNTATDTNDFSGNKVFTEDTIDIFFIYEPTGKVTVKYVDQDTNEEIATADHLTGIVDDEYSTAAKPVEHYTLVTSPDHTTGQYTEASYDTPIEVIYYYTKNTGKVIVHYVDTEGNVLAEPEELTDKVGENYDTKSYIKNIDNYFYLNPRFGDKETGKYTEEDIDVYYVYMNGTYTGETEGLKGDIFIRKDGEEEWNTENEEVFSGLYENDKFDIGTSLEIAPIKQQLNDVVEALYKLKTGKAELTQMDQMLIRMFKNSITLSDVNSVFTTELVIPKGIKLPEYSEDSYKLLSLDGTNYEASYADGMYYLLPANILESEDGTIVRLSMVLKDQTGIEDYSSLYEQFAALETALNAEPDYLTFMIYGAQIEEGVKNQTLTINGEVNGSLDADAVAYNENRHFRYDWGSTQNHTEPNWNDAKDATLAEGAHNIQLTLQVLAKSTVTTHYVDKDTGDTIAEDKVVEYTTGEEYTTIKEEITDYTYAYDTFNTTGVVTEEPIEVTYFYVKNNGTVKVHYVARDGEATTELDLIEKEGRIGTTYTASAKSFTHYALVESPEEATVTYSSENQDLYYYYEWIKGSVTVHYVADDQDEDLDTVELEPGKVDSPYETEAKDIAHYTLTGDSGNRTGVYTENPIEVFYYYTRKIGQVIVNYLDRDTSEQLDTVTYTGKVAIDGEEEPATYTTELKEFENYTLDPNQEEQTGTFTEEDQIINYYYTINNGKVTVHYVADDQDEDLDTVVIDDQKIGTTYETEAKEFDHYTLVGTPSNATGTVTPEEIEVIYNYTRNIGKVIVNYVDSISGELLDSVEYTGKVAIEGEEVSDTYTTELKTFENYTLDPNQEVQTGTYTEETITITYTYTKNEGLVVVHYVDVDNEDEELDTETINDKRIGEEYTTVQKAFTNYHYVDKSDNTKGTVTAEQIDVYYYYEKNNGTILVHHVDAETNDELLVEEFTGKIDTTKETSSKTFTHYTLTEEPENPTATFAADQVDVYYYYTWNRGNVTVHYVADDQDEDLDTVTLEPGKVDSPYETEAKDIAHYTLTGDSGNRIGIYTEDLIEVFYYYTRNIGKVIVHYVDLDNNNEELDRVELSGKVALEEEEEPEIYTTEQKTFENYTFESSSDNTTGKYTEEDIDVYYYYNINNGLVTVHYVAEDQDEDLDTVVIDDQKIGTTYETEAKEFEHYTLVEIPANANGPVTATPTEVIYNYVRNVGKVIVHYVADDQDEDLDTVESTGKVVTESYTTELKIFENYTLDPDQEVQEIVYDEETQEVTYTYSKNLGVVTVHYVADDQDEDLDTVVIDDQRIGTTYETEAKEFEHYTLVGTPSNANGPVTATPTEVIYNYVRNVGTVIIHYVADDQDEDLDTVESTGRVVTESYTTELKEFENYTLDPDQEVQEIVYDEETQEVTYTYTKNKGVVIVHYVDVDNEDEELDTETIDDKKIDEEYTTVQKEFTDYHYVDKSDNTKGTVTAEQIDVYYYYEKNNGTIIVHHVGTKGEETTELDTDEYTGKIGTTKDTTSQTFTHYVLVEAPEEETITYESEPIDVYYYYEWIKGNVTVHYVADDQEEELDTVELESKDVDSPYETEAKEFDTYTLTGDSGNRTGVYTEENIDVYYYYTRNAGKVIVHHIDVDTNEDLDIVESNGKVGDEYTAEPKEFENYELVSSPEEETVTYTEDTIELTYGYKKYSGTVIVYYKDLFTGEEIEGVEPKETTDYVDVAYDEQPIYIEGYEFVRTEGTTTGNYPKESTVEITHYYQRVGKVITHHYEVDTTDSVADDEETTGPINTYYVTSPVENVEGYSLAGHEGEPTGKYSEELIEVIYYYQKLGKVITHFLDNAGNELIDSKEQTGVVGDGYETTPEEIEGFVLTGTPENATGEYTKEDINVNYIYTEYTEPVTVYGNVHVTHVTLDGEVLEEKTITEEVGDGYETTRLDNADTYELISVSGDPTGTVELGTKEVVYVYKEITEPTPEVIYGTVIAHYIDKDGNTLFDDIKLMGEVGTDYNAPEIPVEGYTLIDCVRVNPQRFRKALPEGKPNKGLFEDGTIELNFIYEKDEEPTPEVEEGVVIAYFVDENGNSIADPMIISGVYGTTYITYQKVISGYTGTSIPENRIGKINQELLELTYTYAKDEEPEQEDPGSCNNCNSCCCNTCNCEQQQPQIIINITNEVSNDTNVENNNEDTNNVNNENNPVNNNETNVTTGDTNVENNVETGDTNVENNTNVETGDNNNNITTGDTTVTTGDTTVETGDTNVTTGDTTIENNPTIENNTNVETGDTTIENNPTNTVETGDTNVTTGDTNVENNTEIENNPTNTVENNTDVDASSTNNNENVSESNNEIENNSNSESNSESNPVINLDNSSSSESNPTIDNSTTVENNPTNTNEANPTNTVNVEANPTNTNENNPTNNNEANPTNSNENNNESNASNTNETNAENNNESNPTNNNDGSNTNVNENNNNDTCDDCNGSEEPTPEPQPEPQPEDPTPEGKVIVKYVDEEGYSISPMVTIPGNVNDDYTTDQLRIAGYEIDSVEGETEGQIAEGTKFVTYRYRVATPAQGKVIVHFRDEEGNTIASDEQYVGNVGEEYNILEQYIKGYELTEIKKLEQPTKMRLMLKRAVINEDLSKGTYTEGTTELVYVYKTVEEEPSDPSESEGKECCNTTVIVNCENNCPDVEPCPEPTPTPEPEPSTGTVVVTYIDTEGNELAPSTSQSGEVGEGYETAPAEVAGFTVTTIVGDEEGEFIAGEKQVIYIYTKDNEPEAKKGQVIARYVDTLGNKIAGNVTFKGTVGTEYETFAKEIDGYEFVKVIGEVKGVYTEADKEVIYVYTKVTNGEVEDETLEPEDSGTGSTEEPDILPPHTGVELNIIPVLEVALLAGLILRKKEN